MTFWEGLWWQIGLDLPGAVGVLLASIVLYLVFTTILQVAGQRLSANPSVLSVAVMALLGALSAARRFSYVLLLGALTARAILGNSPTLVGGLIAVATLLVMEYALGSVRFGATRRFALRGPRPTVVMVHGHKLTWQLRHVGLLEVQLLAQLRRAGVRHVADADLVIMEPRGGLTIVRRGETIDRRMVRDVRGIGIVPRSILR